MPVNDTTTNQGYQKPNIANTLADDVGRLRSALDAIDTDMASKAPSAGPTFTGVTTVDAGSAAAPSLTFTGATSDTGFYSPGANQVAISTSGTGRLFVDASGRIGVGTTSATAYGMRLAVIENIGLVPATQDTITTSAVAIKTQLGSSGGEELIRSEITSFTNGANYGTATIFITRNGASTTERMRIDSSGRVGIGTASPARILDIAGTSVLTFRVKNTDSTSATQAQFHNDSDNGPTIISYGSTYAGGSILNVGANGTAINVTQGLGINAGSTYQIQFGIGNTERMRIDSSGRLLVGTSASRSSAFGAPLFQVEYTSGLASVTRNAVDGFGSAFILGKSRGTSYETLVANDNIGIYSFHGANGSAMVEAARIQCDVDGTVSGGGAADMPGRLVFSTTADGAGTPTERMRIDSSGRVGIGTTPSAPLDIAVGGAGPARVQFSQTADHPYIDLYRSNGAGGFTGFRVSNTSAISGELVFSGTTSGTAIGSHTFTERARIDSSGRLLVGTSTSRNVGADFILQLEAEDASAGAAVIRHGGTTAASGPNVRFARSRGTTSGAVTAVTVGDTLGYLGWFGADGTDLGNEAANIRCEVANAVSSNIVPGDLVFSTTNSTGTLAEIVRMTGEGLVGINNNAPDSTLSVQNSSGGRIAKFIGTSAPFPITIDDQARILSGNSSSRAIVTEARVQIETTGAYALSVCNNAATATGALITLGKSRSATVGGSTAVIANDVLGYLRFAGADGTDVNTVAADIRCDVDATVAANVVPGRLTFHTASSAGTLLERARITSDGYLRLAATNSLGIQFNGDTAAANALDDYEEGTFTPTLVGGTTSGTGTYTNQTGRYTKIGNRVFIHVYLSWTAHTGTGAMRVSGLPFTSVSGTQYDTVLASLVSDLTLSANAVLQVYVVNGSTNILLNQVVPNGGTTGSVTMDTSGLVVFSGHYFV